MNSVELSNLHYDAQEAIIMQRKCKNNTSLSTKYTNMIKKDVW